MINEINSLSKVERAEMLKNLVTGCAVGGDRTNSSMYVTIRMFFLREPKTAERLPMFIKTCRNLNEIWNFIQPKFRHYHERRAFIRDEFEGLLAMLEIQSHAPADDLISESTKLVNSTYIQETWKKALERRANDPEGAITAARTLLESVCKHILDSLLVTYADASDLPKLYSLAAKQLNLSPSQHTELVFKQILGGCHSVVEGLGALRNQHGDAHGSGVLSAKRPSSRHAELAVNLSGAMAAFLLQTWEAKK